MTTLNLTKFLIASALATALASPSALAQASETTHSDPCQTPSGPITTKTFYLTNTNTDNRVNLDGSELLGTLRHMLCSNDKVDIFPAQNAIVVQASPDRLALAENLISELDRPRKAYRLTYTLTELNAGKTIGTQHYSMVVVRGQHTTMKEGDKIPVAIGSFSNGASSSAANAGVQTQFTYLDIGMNFDATLNEATGGFQLDSKVEQSSLGQPSTIAGVTEPVVRQTVLQGTSFLTPGKPILLGSIDTPDSTHHFDIAVVLDPLK